MLSNESSRNPSYGVVDVDGGHATNSVIHNVVYNLPDKSGLWMNAHYSNWTDADDYPGVHTSACNGKFIGMCENGWLDAFLYGAVGCYLYEAYGNVILETSDQSGGHYNFAAKASAVPYSMFFL